MTDQIKCECGCGCESVATTRDGWAIPVCDACAVYTVDPDIDYGDIHCSREDRMRND